MDTRLVCMELLQRKFKGEITQQELDQECAYILLQFLDDFKFTLYPQKPTDILDYIERRQNDPDYKASENFWRLPYILQYLHDHKAARSANNSGYATLKLTKEGLLEGDLINLQKVIAVLKEYPDNYMDLSMFIYKKEIPKVKHETTIGKEIKERFQY